MSLSRLILFSATLTLALASSVSSYRITLFQPSLVGGTELKPGDYKIEVNGDQAVIKAGKNTVQATVKVENSEEKFPSTAVRYANGDGKYRIQEIRLGGTHTKLVFIN